MTGILEEMAAALERLEERLDRIEKALGGAPQHDPAEVLSAVEVAKLIGRSSQYIRTLCRRGQRKQQGRVIHGPYLVATRLGMTWRIERGEVTAMLRRDRDDD